MTGPEIPACSARRSPALFAIGGATDAWSKRQKITRSQGKLKIELPETQIACDKVVIAAGMGSREIAAKIGMKLPIAPAKGYSLSVPYESARYGTGSHHCRYGYPRSGVNPLGNILRVAGTAEFCGF